MHLLVMSIYLQSPFVENTTYNITIMCKTLIMLTKKRRYAPPILPILLYLVPLWGVV